MGPVTDLAIADAHQVGQAVGVHVRQIDRLRGVGEDEARPGLFIQRLLHPPGGPEPFFCQRCMPDEGVVFGNQRIGAAIAVQIDETQVGIARVSIQTAP